MTSFDRPCRWVLIMLTVAVICGCNRESARRPIASGSADGYGSSDGHGPTGRAPGKKGPSGIIVETPITTTSRLVFGGHEWKRDPTGSIEGSGDLPEMMDDGIEDSFTPYVTDDPKLRLFYMFTGEGHRIYVRELDKGRWVTMKTLFIKE